MLVDDIDQPLNTERLMPRESRKALEATVRNAIPVHVQHLPNGCPCPISCTVTAATKQVSRSILVPSDYDTLRPCLIATKIDLLEYDDFSSPI